MNGLSQDRKKESIARRLGFVEDKISLMTQMNLWVLGEKPFSPNRSYLTLSVPKAL